MISRILNNNKSEIGRLKLDIKSKNDYCIEIEKPIEKEINELAKAYIYMGNYECTDPILNNTPFNSEIFNVYLTDFKSKYDAIDITEIECISKKEKLLSELFHFTAIRTNHILDIIHEKEQKNSAIVVEAKGLTSHFVQISKDNKLDEITNILQKIYNNQEYHIMLLKEIIDLIDSRIEVMKIRKYYLSQAKELLSL